MLCWYSPEVCRITKVLTDDVCRLYVWIFHPRSARKAQAESVLCSYTCPISRSQGLCTPQEHGQLHRQSARLTGAPPGQLRLRLDPPRDLPEATRKDDAGSLHSGGHKAVSKSVTLWWPWPLTGCMRCTQSCKLATVVQQPVTTCMRVCRRAPGARCEGWKAEVHCPQLRMRSRFPKMPLEV